MLATTIFKVLTTCRLTSCKIRAGFYQEKARGGHIVQWEGPPPFENLRKHCCTWFDAPCEVEGAPGKFMLESTLKIQWNFFPKCLTFKNSLMIWTFNCMTTHFSETKVMETRCIFNPLCDNCRHERINDHYRSALAPKPHQ